MAKRGKEDALYHRAKQEGFAARSVYKLQEIDKRYRLLKRGQRILDLGAHPGSWLQWTTAKVGPGGLVVGVDIQEPAVELPPNARWLTADLTGLDPAEVPEYPPPFDLVLSDAAPQTTGIVHADVHRSQELSAAAVELGLQVLKPGGGMVVKVFQGQGLEDLVRPLKGRFKMAKTYTPTATTKGSREVFVVASGFKG